MTDKFFEGSEAVFAAMGPMNERTERALGIIGEILQRGEVAGLFAQQSGEEPS